MRFHIGGPLQADHGAVAIHGKGATTIAIDTHNLIRAVAQRVLRTKYVVASVRRARLSVDRLVYRRGYSLEELRELLRNLGFSRGRVVWVQSSWNDFFNLRAKPTDVIALMRDLLGPDGTLVMPAFPLSPDPAKVLQIDSEPSSAGLLTEIFRRTPGVKRSIHLTSSVCALGPAADFLVRDHHLDVYPWGPNTPYCRLMDVDARLVTLGLGRFVTNLTPLHAVECLLHDELPFFQRVFDGTIKYRWRRNSGETGEHEYRRRGGRLSMRGYGQHFPSDLYIELRQSNLTAFATDAKKVIDGAIALARRGITIYAEPKWEADLFVPCKAATVLPARTLPAEVQVAHGQRYPLLARDISTRRQP